MYISVLQLQCCGYSSVFDNTVYYEDSTGSKVIGFGQSLFCCASNPITKGYNYDMTCTRFTEVSSA